MIKIVSGIRRCGKSFLLSTLYAKWLKKQGVADDHIINVKLEDRRNKALRDLDKPLAFIDSKIKDNNMHYKMIDDKKSDKQKTN